jgi:transcriptional regulator GlxA family with amidase domain
MRKNIAILGNAVFIEWIRTRLLQADVTMSVCTGALLLARAGLLDGLRVTTHHELLGTLRELAPRAILDPGARYHDTGSLITAAGISAGIDSSLHRVARLLGAEASAETAAYMEYGPGH